MYGMNLWICFNDIVFYDNALSYLVINDSVCTTTDLDNREQKIQYKNNNFNIILRESGRP